MIVSLPYYSKVLYRRKFMSAYFKPHTVVVRYDSFTFTEPTIEFQSHTVSENWLNVIVWSNIAG